MVIWSKAASAEAEFKGLKDGSPALLGRALLFLRRCWAWLSLLHSSAAADNNHLHSWQPLHPCPPLRQSLSLGWPVRPGLGRLIRLRRWKKRHSFAQGPSCRAVLGPLLPALCLGSCAHLKGWGDRTRELVLAAGSSIASMQTCPRRSSRF